MRSLVVSLLVSGLALTSCTHTPRPGESIEEACTLENDGKVVTFSGHLVAPKHLMNCAVRCTLSVSQSRDGEDRSAFTSFEPGGGNGQIEKLEREFTERDVRIKDSAGNRFGVGDAIRLTGKVTVQKNSEGGLNCSMMNPEKIEEL
jgi:hypothetical protein